MSELDPARREEIERLAQELAGQDVYAWGPDQDEIFESWSDEELKIYFRARARVAFELAPARAPAPWPAALVFVALDVAALAVARRRAPATFPFHALATPVSAPLRTWFERRRARQLGLWSAADLAPVPVRMPVFLRGVPATVSIPIPFTGFDDCTTAVVFAVGSRLVIWLAWDRQHRESPEPTWPIDLGRALSLELMRRYDRRRAGGPTR